MKVVSINISKPKKELLNGREIFTAIKKQPISGSIYLSKEGLDGDGVADKKHHGGHDKAICLYASEHFKYWQEKLNIEFKPAAFGENFTLSGVFEPNICIGDTFKVGEAIVQVSQPREPCHILEKLYQRRGMIQEIIDSGFTGFYCRVLSEGEVSPGSSFEPLDKDPSKISIDEANQIRFFGLEDESKLRKILKVEALAESWRQKFQSNLENLNL